MAIIDKKILKEYFDAILEGQKNYELRLADFKCQAGDTLLLREYDPKKKVYTGRELRKQITYVGKFKIDELFWSREEIEKNGLQILSLEDEK